MRSSVRSSDCTGRTSVGSSGARATATSSDAAEYYCHTRHDPLNATTHLVAAHVLSAA